MSMDINKTKVGDYIVFANPDNGTEYDKEITKKYLTVGHKYKVDLIRKYDDITDVWLDTYDEWCFNSVMFDNIPVSIDTHIDNLIDSLDLDQLIAWADKLGVCHTKSQWLDDQFPERIEQLRDRVSESMKGIGK